METREAPVAGASTIDTPLARRATSRRVAFGLGGLAMLVAVGVLAARGGRSEPEIEAAPRARSRDVPYLRDDKIVFSATFAERVGIEDAEVTVRDVVPVVRATGTVAFDPQRMSVVGSRIAARVRTVAVVPGQRVKKGDVLVRLEAAELANAQAELEVLRARSVTIEADAERKRKLAAEGIAAERAAQLAETELRAIDIEREAARRRVRALGGRVQRSRMGEFSLTTPIEGEVVEVGVAAGQPLEANVSAIRVADLSEVWVELAVFERELADVRAGDEVMLVPRSRPETRIRGRVDHVGAILDPRTRSATVRVVVPNTERLLAIGESVIAEIATRGEAVRSAALPRDSVVLVDGHPTAFVVVDEGTVEPRRLDITAEGDTWIAVSDGVVAGERVVTRGTFALKSELFR